MIFTPEHCQMILAGTKTATRRVVKETHMVSEGIFIGHALGHLIDGVSVPAVRVDPSWRDVYAVGKTYAVQPGRGKHAIAHIRLTAIEYVAHAGEISLEDARAEGYGSPEAFCAVYAKLNGEAALDAPCWALTFDVVREGQ